MYCAKLQYENKKKILFLVVSKDKLKNSIPCATFHCVQKKIFINL